MFVVTSPRAYSFCEWLTVSCFLKRRPTGLSAGAYSVTLPFGDLQHNFLTVGHFTRDGNLGVLAGSLLGARILGRARTHAVRAVFAVVIGVLGMEMIYNGMTGRL